MAFWWLDILKHKSSDNNCKTIGPVSAKEHLHFLPWKGYEIYSIVVFILVMSFGACISPHWHPSTMERLFKKNNNHICQVQLLTICHYSKFTYIPNTCCSCSSHSVNLLFLGSWKKSTQVTAQYRKIKLYSQTFCCDEGQTLTTSVRNSTWWPIHIINSLSVDKTKLSLSCNNIYEKITHVWLAENKCIFHVTQVKITNGMCTSKISSLLTFCDAFFM